MFSIKCKQRNSRFNRSLRDHFHVLKSTHLRVAFGIEFQIGYSDQLLTDMVTFCIPTEALTFKLKYHCTVMYVANCGTVSDSLAGASNSVCFFLCEQACRWMADFLSFCLVQWLPGGLVKPHRTHDGNGGGGSRVYCCSIRFAQQVDSCVVALFSEVQIQTLFEGFTVAYAVKDFFLKTFLPCPVHNEKLFIFIRNIGGNVCNFSTLEMICAAAKKYMPGEFMITLLFPQLAWL